MKQHRYILALCLGLLSFSGCDKMSVIGLNKEIPLTFTSPDGKTRTIQSKSSGDEGAELAFSTTEFYNPSDIEGCVWINAATNGRMVDDLFFLSIYMKENSRIGREPEFERINFCLPFSSNSEDYTSSYSGHIYLKEFNDERLVLRFDKTVFKVFHGKYTLNGDMEFSARDISELLEQYEALMNQGQQQ